MLNFTQETTQKAIKYQTVFTVLDKHALVTIIFKLVMSVDIEPENVLHLDELLTKIDNSLPYIADMA